MAQVPAGDKVRRAVGRRDPERVARPRYLPGAGLPARPARRGPGFPLPAGGRLQQQRPDPPPPGIPAHRHDNPLRLDPALLTAWPATNCAKRWSGGLPGRGQNSAPRQPTARPMRVTADGKAHVSATSGASASAPRWEFLEGPRVAVQVGEEHELAPRLYVDLTGLDPAFHELLARGLDVADHDLHALLRPGRHLGD